MTTKIIELTDEQVKAIVIGKELIIKWERRNEEIVIRRKLIMEDKE